MTTFRFFLSILLSFPYPLQKENGLFISAESTFMTNFAAAKKRDLNTYMAKKAIICLNIIGEDCWLGGGVIVCPGVTIGDRCIIAAGSVVTRDIPSDSMAAGVPAVVKKILKSQER